MSWSAYLFDLDGVLVRSEQLHQEAYRQACARHGHRLDWSFERYCLAAHYGPERLEEELRAAMPGLLEEIGFAALYGEKSQIYMHLLSQGVPLQPGAEDVLQRLKRGRLAHAVVTNSTREQTALLRRHHAVLDAVEEWVTREDYAAAKPAPDAYLEALRRLAVTPDQAIGFEDTPRGLRALVAAGVPGVLVSSVAYPDLDRSEPLLAIASLAELPSRFLTE